MQDKVFIISLGGSTIVPDNIDVNFLSEFRKLIISHARKGKKFIIIAGGGRTARNYMDAAGKIVSVSPEDKDWLGIHSTRLNAHLLRIIFKEYSNAKLVKNPNKMVKFRKSIIIAAGYKPGCSTDYDSVLLAKNLGVKSIINISNISYVYTRDPNKFSDAKPIREISWKDFRKIVGKKWDPGLNVPFDPVASRACEVLKMKVFIVGKNLKNLNCLLLHKSFEGTLIR